MSIKAFSNGFQNLQLADEEDYSAFLNEIIYHIFNPSTPLSPPSEYTGFHLEQREGLSIMSILSEVQNKVIAHSVNVRHVWSLAHMVPPPASISVVADLLIGAMNQCAFIWEEAPLASIIEGEVIGWMNRRVGFEEGTATGILTSGGTMSNCIATYLALTKAHREFARGNKRNCIICSDQAHFSVEKAAAFTSSNSISVIRVPTNTRGRLGSGDISSATEEALRMGLTPFLFICTAGTTNSGSLESPDEFLTCARLCNSWCHIDAAHGGMISLSAQATKYISQWQKADSISWDPHKSLYVSYSSGALLLRDKSMLMPLQFSSEYAFKENSCADPGFYHLDSSRRFEALKIWMTIKYFGLVGFSKAINQSLLLAQEFAKLIRSKSDFELTGEPDTNIICFRFIDPDLGESELNRINESVQKRLFLSGGPLISSTKISGNSVLRVVLINQTIELTHLREILNKIQIEAHRQVSILKTQKTLPSV
jgi:L-2,4-diaminobutyrate decarboxylase